MTQGHVETHRLGPNGIYVQMRQDQGFVGFLRSVGLTTGFEADSFVPTASCARWGWLGEAARLARWLDE